MGYDCFFWIALIGEHLWPRSYGLRRGHPEYNDLHNLRPADANGSFALCINMHV